MVIMKRTTLPLPPSLLKSVREIARQEGMAMGKVIAQLVELGLKARAKSASAKRPKALNWHCQSMKAKVDYEDKDALFKAMDSEK